MYNSKESEVPEEEVLVNWIEAQKELREYRQTVTREK
jgi:hypothetical protein